MSLRGRCTFELIRGETLTIARLEEVIYHPNEPGADLRTR